MVNIFYLNGAAGLICHCRGFIIILISSFQTGVLLETFENMLHLSRYKLLHFFSWKSCYKRGL